MATTSNLPSTGVSSELDNLETVDWQQLYLMAKMTPNQRMLAMAQTSAFARSILRGAFRRRFPNLTMSEVNMLMMRYISAVPEYPYE